MRKTLVTQQLAWNRWEERMSDLSVCHRDHRRLAAVARSRELIAAQFGNAQSSHAVFTGRLSSRTRSPQHAAEIVVPILAWRQAECVNYCEASAEPLAAFAANVRLAVFASAARPTHGEVKNIQARRPMSFGGSCLVWASAT